MELVLSSLPDDKESLGEAAEIPVTSPIRRLLGRVQQHRAAQVLRYRDFRLLWFGHVFGSMSFWMDQVTRGWLIYELTDSTVQLGMIRGVQAIPILFLSPIAGSVADRY